MASRIGIAVAAVVGLGFLAFPRARCSPCSA